MNPKLILWENDLAPAEAVTPRNPANRSGQHQLPTASNTQLADQRIKAPGCCLSVNRNFLVTKTEMKVLKEEHMRPYRGQEGRRARSLLKPLLPLCRRARDQFRQECLCTLLAGCRYPAHSQRPEQLLYRQELRVMWCSRRTRPVPATKGPLQGFRCRAMAPY